MRMAIKPGCELTTIPDLYTCLRICRDMLVNDFLGGLGIVGAHHDEEAISRNSSHGVAIEDRFYLSAPKVGAGCRKVLALDLPSHPYDSLRVVRSVFLNGNKIDAGAVDVWFGLNAEAFDGEQVCAQSFKLFPVDDPAQHRNRRPLPAKCRASALAGLSVWECHAFMALPRAPHGRMLSMMPIAVSSR